MNNQLKKLNQSRNQKNTDLIKITNIKDYTIKVSISHVIIILSIKWKILTMNALIILAHVLKEVFVINFVYVIQKVVK